MDDIPAAAARHRAGEDAEARRSARIVQRSKETRASVIYGERIAKWLISVGGLLVIVAVFGIMVFLFQVAMPLFQGGELLRHVQHRIEAKPLAWLNADEFQTLATRVGTDGRVTTFHIATGRPVREDWIDLGGQSATAVGGTLERDRVAFGFGDGTVRFARIGFDVGTVQRRNAPADLVRLNERDFLSGQVIFTPVQTGDFRTITAVTTIGEPIRVSERPIVALDYRVGGTVERPTIAFVTVDEAGIARLSRSVVQRNLLTGAERVRTTTTELPALPEGTQVTAALLSTSADRVIISSREGFIYRYDLRDPARPVLAERRRVFPDGVAVTAIAFLNGEQTLIVGGSNGAVDAFFRLQRPGVQTADGFELVRARVHEPQPAAIIDIAPGQRDKSFATTDAAGGVWYRHSTSDQVLFRFARSGDATTASQAMVYPRGDGILKVDDRGTVDSWAVHEPHREITWSVLFGRVWYEGYPEPGFTWQSTAGTDTFESKFSLVPLIFGTMKATFYAMLFGLPIALMGAIYTSEFLHRGVRATVKPVMEMMESLPTVVLGFVAALVLAPFVEEWIAAVLLAFIAVPLGLLLAAHLWQMLPTQLALRYDGIPKFALMGVVIAVTAWLAYQVGPLFEAALFAGNFKAWVNGDFGTGTPFMTFLLWPLWAVLTGMAFKRFAGHHLRERVRASARPQAGRLLFAKWVALALASLIVSWLFASLLTLIGFDPRGGIVDTYAQRNALVVGFIMGFAVIPNIYTLAEDALNSVPAHLRSASLACGATPWQTAMWVILPTAASGVFSASMIGMGRAVGETMIVVMAAGNTPIMEWNIFSGLRTLSANIAIELPEAVKDETNYRVLFLAALTLFVMTFIINTIAELIRQRFRKRAFQL
jgi:phosphate transport system permease protein